MSIFNQNGNGVLQSLKSGLRQLLQSFAMTTPLPIIARSVSDEAIQKNHISTHDEYSTTITSFALLYMSLSTPLLAKDLTLACPHGTIPFKVELAQSPDEQAKGLMFRTHLREDEGMLFLFPKPKSATMWMKNTPLALDMIFCNEKGEILAIHENTTPYSLNKIGPVEGTAQALEIKGGTVQKHGITHKCELIK